MAQAGRSNAAPRAPAAHAPKAHAYVHPIAQPEPAPLPVLPAAEQTSPAGVSPVEEHLISNPVFAGNAVRFLPYLSVVSVCLTTLQSFGDKGHWIGRTGADDRRDDDP